MEKCTEHVLSLRHLLKCLKAPPKFSCSVCVSQTLGLVGMCASRNRYRHFWLHSFYWFGIFFSKQYIRIHLDTAKQIP